MRTHGNSDRYGYEGVSRWNALPRIYNDENNQNERKTDMLKNDDILRVEQAMMYLRGEGYTAKWTYQFGLNGEKKDGRGRRMVVSQSWVGKPEDRELGQGDVRRALGGLWNLVFTTYRDYKYVPTGKVNPDGTPQMKCWYKIAVLFDGNWSLV